MAIEMVRIPSETPNISNTDDFVGLRYAYGNQNGYVINKGLECSFTPLSAKFKINSGRLVLQGVECDINANGVEITIDNVATTRYYTVYLQVNLATNEAKILSEYGTDTYPQIASGNDLTATTNGTATMELYHFDATSGIISNVSKVVKEIKYVSQISLELKSDNNGVIKIGDMIIPQKKLIYNNLDGFKLIYNRVVVTIDNPSNYSFIGKTLEVEFSTGDGTSYDSNELHRLVKFVARKGATLDIWEGDLKNVPNSINSNQPLFMYKLQGGVNSEEQPNKLNMGFVQYNLTDKAKSSGLGYIYKIYEIIE